MPFMSRDKYPLQFEKDIDKYSGEAYATYPSEYTKVAKVSDFPSGRVYRQAQSTGLGMFRNWAEGEGVPYDLPAEGNDTFITVEGRILGYQYTSWMLKDSLHPERIKSLNTSLSENARFRQDVDVFRMLAQANGTTYRKAPDGLALLANNHTTLKSGDTINNLAAGSLSQTTFEAGFQYFMTLVKEEGVPLVANPNLLIVSNVQDYMLAQQLFTQDMALNSGYGSTDLNRVNPKNGIVPTYQILFSRTLDRIFANGVKNTPGAPSWSVAGKAWFLCDTSKMDLKMLWQDKFEVTTGEDFNTGNALVKATMRYAVGIGDYKAVYGYVG
jgi:hypothetical protein